MVLPSYRSIFILTEVPVVRKKIYFACCCYQPATPVLASVGGGEFGVDVP